MVLAQGYINEPSAQDAFIVQSTPDKRRAFQEYSMNPSGSGNFGGFQTPSLDTIPEQSRRLHRTSPNVSSPSPFSMDVFGENVDSLDVWAEEDVFHSSRKHRRGSQTR